MKLAAICQQKLRFLVDMCSKFLQKSLLCRCILCGQIIRFNDTICELCWQDLPWLRQPSCIACALPIPKTTNVKYCGYCLQQKERLFTTIAILEYRYPIDLIIKNFKYKANFTYYRILTDLMAKQISKHFSAANHILLPVPLHINRQKERGFNQAHVLCSKLQKLGWKLGTKLVTRIKDTPKQSHAKRKHRYLNLKRAFSVDYAVKDLEIVIIDDVLTTGATVTSLAKELYKKGAKKVYVCCLARAII